MVDWVWPERRFLGAGVQGLEIEMENHDIFLFAIYLFKCAFIQISWAILYEPDSSSSLDNPAKDLKWGATPSGFASFSDP